MSEFSKTKKQSEAIKLLSSEAQNLMLYGGSRSGKTFILCYSILVRASKVKSRHVILRQNFNHVKRSIWMDTLPKCLNIAFPDLKPHPNKTDFFYSLANGSEVWIGGMDDAKRVEKILGNEYSTIYFNECSQLDYSSVQIVKTRLAEKNTLKKKVYYDANPPTKSHWTYWVFEKGIDPLSEEPIKDPDNYLSLLMNPMDNIENIDENYIDLLDKMPTKERNRFLLGEYNDESSGQVYYSFKPDLHIKEFDRFPGSIFIGMDFNVNPFCAVIFQYVDGKFYVFDELFLENSDTYKMCDELKSRGYSGLTVIPDSTGANRKTSGQSDFQILRSAGFKIESTHNPFVMDRVNNVNRVLSSDKMIVHPRCKKLIVDLQKVVWKDNALDQSGPNKMLTHISDALGYGIWKLDPFGSVKKKYDLVPR